MLGKVFVIEVVPRTKWDPGFYGTTDAGKQEILVAEGQAHEAERDTVLHEILHAIDYSLSTKLTERQVHATACALLSVLRCNPNLVRYLLSERKR